ncbi:unnamed protein product [Lampetra planeri]
MVAAASTRSVRALGGTNAVANGTQLPSESALGSSPGLAADSSPTPAVILCGDGGVVLPETSYSSELSVRWLR